MSTTLKFLVLTGLLTVCFQGCHTQLARNDIPIVEEHPPPPPTLVVILPPPPPPEGIRPMPPLPRPPSPPPKSPQPSAVKPEKSGIRPPQRGARKVAPDRVKKKESGNNLRVSKRKVENKSKDGNL